MALSDLIDKIKQWVAQNPEKVNNAFEKGGEQLKNRFGHEDQIDKGLDQARQRLTGDGDGGNDPSPPDTHKS
jgi:hypothetical protein